MPKDKHRVRDSGEYLPSRKRNGSGDTDKSSHVTQRITRRMTTDAARDAVLYTAELLEQIFEYLPPRSILTAQRVCHQFCDIVARSAELQNKMLGKDESAIMEKWVVKRTWGHHSGLTHSSVKPRQYFLPSRNANTDMWQPDNYTLVTYNSLPFIPQQPMSEQDYCVDVAHGDLWLEFIPSLTSVLLGLLRKEQKASWYDMQLSSPSATKVDIRLCIRFGPVILMFVYLYMHSDTPWTLGAVLHNALHSREDGLAGCRHAYVLVTDGTRKTTRAYVDAYGVDYEQWQKYPLGSTSLAEVILAEEARLGVEASMDLAPSLCTTFAMQPSEALKDIVRKRGLEEED